jgi:hypothetical protein
MISWSIEWQGSSTEFWLGINRFQAIQNFHCESDPTRLTPQTSESIHLHLESLTSMWCFKSIGSCLILNTERAESHFIRPWQGVPCIVDLRYSGRKPTQDPASFGLSRDLESHVHARLRRDWREPQHLPSRSESVSWYLFFGQTIFSISRILARSSLLIEKVRLISCQFRTGRTVLWTTKWHWKWSGSTCPSSADSLVDTRNLLANDLYLSEKGTVFHFKYSRGDSQTNLAQRTLTPDC